MTTTLYRINQPQAENDGRLVVTNMAPAEFAAAFGPPADLVETYPFETPEDVLDRLAAHFPVPVLRPVPPSKDDLSDDQWSRQADAYFERHEAYIDSVS